ncbi:hypothetical protein FOA43_003035 [Brettanomyces nanus]|uniref:Transcription factor CBF/NF-Y/archaeal histone domain-containing protein n=1 Tax=Eeniella nana TaxID=13502 RepID=A0A875S2V4_EENNA|nr:uncharacterized protein FOA43_003035 [Brettanomyces nanus]QPG75676.1 hypothetical protein FOA43_003035 [Brettanomyces nanus]
MAVSPGQSESVSPGETASTGEFVSPGESVSLGESASPEKRASPRESVDPLFHTKFYGSEGYKRIKTHFPSARIKKLMQSDEDIGKVAQATPVALGRALEMFMCTLVERSLETAQQDRMKKVNVQILKKTVETNEQFDFVVGICDKYLSKGK